MKEIRGVAVFVVTTCYQTELLVAILPILFGPEIYSVTMNSF